MSTWSMNRHHASQYHQSLVIVFATILGLNHASTATYASTTGAAYGYLTTNGVAIFGNADPGHLLYWHLNASTTRCALGSSYLNVVAANLKLESEPEVLSRAQSATDGSAMMLMVNTAGVDPVATSLGGDRWHWTNRTYTDSASYQLRRPEQIVHIPVDEENVSSVASWIIGVFNADTNGPAKPSQALNFSIRAWCSDTPSCPRNCSGEGHCSSAGICTCNEGRGGVDCSAEVKVLESGVHVSAALASTGMWKYYMYQGSQVGEEVMVEMTRSRGDLILFAKLWGEGAVPLGLPTVYDFNAYADRHSSREHLDHHFRHLTPAPGNPVLVGVYNSDDDDRKGTGEAGKFELVVRSGPSASLCPFNCSFPAGICTAVAGRESTCVCQPGYQGKYCQGSYQMAARNKRLDGRLAPGKWAFVGFDFDSDDGKMIIILTRSGGQAMLVASNDGSSPDAGRDVFRFPAPSGENPGSARVSVFSMYNREPTPGIFIFGILNENYAVHQTCNFSLVFSTTGLEEALGPGGGQSINSLLIALVSLFGFLVLSLCVGMARGALLTLHSLQQPLPHQPTQGVTEEEGLDPRVVETFALVEYQNGMFGGRGTRSDGEEVRLSPEMSRVEPSCAVCLQDYLPGDSLRSLPSCAHHFHAHCIDSWLRSHITCPICRTVLRRSPNPSALPSLSLSPSPSPSPCPPFSQPSPVPPQLLPSQLAVSPGDKFSRTPDAYEPTFSGQISYPLAVAVTTVNTAGVDTDEHSRSSGGREREVGSQLGLVDDGVGWRGGSEWSTGGLSQQHRRKDDEGILMTPMPPPQQDVILLPQCVMASTSNPGETAGREAAFVGATKRSQSESGEG
eukprot:TRINITY_DN1200_c0_g1_i1.p1 TRINITY_DN1200_c0_g1~~TRINITY_DN1200_c0_g1_i1.p1  ORF type:complete len:847 (+),score=116.48 TRINITY_DN1200_c0_g1_i1:263-2803(+)